MSQLKQKHPDPQSAKLGSLLFGPIDDHYPESVYTQVNGEMVRQAALRTKGARGPSGVDANGFRRIFASKSFKQSSTRLCEAIAIMTRTLCTQYIDPMTIDTLVANRLIPLDKGEGAVRQIGVGEVLRRIFGKEFLLLRRMLSMQAAHSNCVPDKSPEATLKYTLCILYLNQMTLMPYFSSTPLMFSTHSTEQLHGTTSGFCVL